MQITKYIILFLIFFNAGAGLLDEAGVDDDLGLAFDSGDNQALEDAESDADDAAGGSSTSDTLFGLYDAVTSTLDSILNAINPGAEMLKNAVDHDVFDLIVNFSFAGMWLITGITVLQFFRSGQGL